MTEKIEEKAAPKKSARIDWLLADIFVFRVEVTEAMWEMLVLESMAYLKSNGSLPWERWSLLSDVSREAFAEAGERLKIRSVLETTP